MGLRTKAFEALISWRDAGRHVGDAIVKTIGKANTGTLVQIISGQSSNKRGNQQIIQAFAESPWLHGVVRKIAEHVACVEYTALKSSGSRSKLRSLKRVKEYGEQMRVAKGTNVEMIDVPEEHPIWALLERPNKWMSFWEFIELSQILIDLTGGCLWAVDGRKGDEETGIPLSIMVYPTHWVSSWPSVNKPWYVIDYNSRGMRYGQNDVIHLRTVNPGDPYGCGVGLGSVMADEVDTDEAVSKFLKYFFANNARPDFLLGIEGADQAEVDRQAAKWNQRHRGPAMTSRPHFYGGKLTVHEFGKSFGELGVNDLRLFEREVFQFIFGVPPEVMGITAHNRSTMREARATFHRETTIPRIKLIVGGLQQIANMYDENIVMGFNSPIPEDKEMKLQVMRSASWAFSINEWRELAEVPPLNSPEGDMHMMSPGLIPATISDAIALRDSRVAASQAVAAVPPKQLQSTVLDKCYCDDDAMIEHLADVAERDMELRKFDDLTDEEQAAINRLLDEYIDPIYFEQEIPEHYKAHLEEWGLRAIQEVGSEVEFNIIDPKVVSFLNEVSSTRVTMINDTTKDLLRRALGEGVSLGEGIRDLTERVIEVLQDPSKHRAQRIARTEVMRGSNFGKFAGYTQSGVVEKKQWIATESRWDSVRDEHKVLHGKDPIPLNTPWVYDGHEAMHPGDFGAGYLDINCRCTFIAVIDDPKSLSELDAIGKAYLDDVSSWENEMTELVDQVFRQQLDDILPHLDDIASDDDSQ